MTDKPDKKVRLKKDGTPYKMSKVVMTPNPRARSGVSFAPGNSGRPRGSKNKFTTLKKAFVDAFKSMGGEEALLDWVVEARGNKTKFFELLSKMLPKEIELSGKNGGPIEQLQINGEQLTDAELERIIKGADKS